MSFKSHSIKSFVWSYIQQFTNQIVSFIVSIILARLLLPEEFGLIGMLTVFIAIGNILINGGLASSLIRTVNVSSDDYNTVFVFNLIASVIIYIVFFLTAPLISNFYNQPELVSITRVYSLSFIVGAFATVQNSVLIKDMKFKKQLIINTPAFIISSILGIVLAYYGYGVWSLVWSALSNTIISTIVLWMWSPWSPTFQFSKDKFRQHFYYGYKITLSGMIDVIFTNAYQIIIGRQYSSSLVGFYTRANTLMMLPAGNISIALNNVVFPLFSKVQDDAERLKRLYKQIMQVVIFLVTPITVLMGVLANPLVIFLFTEKWLMVVPILQIICFTGILFPLHSYNLLILQVKGRSDLFLRIEIVKKLLLILILGISLFWGFYGMLWGQLLYNILALFINTYYAGRLLKYKVLEQLKDITSSFVYALVMGSAVYFIMPYFEQFGNFAILSVCSSIGLLIYFGIAFIFKDTNFNNIKNILLKRGS